MQSKSRKLCNLLNFIKAPNDMDLMQIMMAKIKRTEARCAIFEQENRQKDLKIVSLQQQIEQNKRSEFFFIG